MTMMLRMAGTLGQRLEVDPALVGWWKFDGNLTDASGNGNHGTVGAGSAAYAAGVYGQAWDNDETRYVNCGNSTSLQITGSITMSAWIRPTEYPSVAQNGILSKFFNTGNQRAYALAILQTGELRSNISENGFVTANTDQTSNATIALNKWSHVAATLDVSTGVRRLYINGDLDISTTTGQTQIHNSTEQLRIGILSIAGLPEDRRFLGQIDNAMIYNRALSASEIKTLYALGSPI